MVEKFFDASCVKQFEKYIIPSLDEWVNQQDNEFLLKSKQKLDIIKREPVKEEMDMLGDAVSNEHRKPSGLEEIQLGVSQDLGINNEGNDDLGNMDVNKFCNLIGEKVKTDLARILSGSIKEGNVDVEQQKIV